MRRRLDSEAPSHFTAPSGSHVPIDYQSEEGPKLSIRVQELFGLDRHPAIAGGRVPLLLELLSPAHRPVQVTRDLPNFWRGSYAAVRAEMKGRYAKHPAPETPVNSRSLTIARDSHGHFTVEARVDGRRLEFMVDTGASVIALRESAAARLGVHPTPRDYTVPIQTANGVGRAAPIRLNMVEIGGIVVRDVPALVSPDSALATNLLGMSFLSRVKFSYDRGKLVLEQ
jgi:clan AA aspartic protease (TIGR02281 family)